MAEKKRKVDKKPVRRFKKKTQTKKKKTPKKHRVILSSRARVRKKTRKPVGRVRKQLRTKRKASKKRKAVQREIPSSAQEQKPAEMSEPSRIIPPKANEVPRGKAIITAPLTKSRTPVNAAVIVSCILAAAVGIFALLYFLNNKCGETFVCFMPVSYAGKTPAETLKAAKINEPDINKRHFDAFMEIAGRAGLNKDERDYFNAHFMRGTLDKMPVKNVARLSAVYAEKSVKIEWTRIRACAGRVMNAWLPARGRIDKKKTDAFISAANAYIEDEYARREAIDFYAGPSVDMDIAGDVAPYYLYYMAHVMIFSNYTPAAGVIPEYPQFAEGDPAEFLGMEEMFRIFGKKAETLDRLAVLIGDAAGKKMDPAAIEKVKKAAAEISAIADSLDMETTQKFLSTALSASLAAQQWAKMENSKLRKPWFETVYDAELDKTGTGRFLNRNKSAEKFTDEEKKLAAASALILYKTSRCMGTFKWSKANLVYSENYRLAHAILMHFINARDAELCEKIADELDRYYAGRYYGTINR